MDVGFFDSAVANLLSAPVLAFILGILAVSVKSNLQLPSSAMKMLSVYLLLAIGIKGGVAVRGAELTELAVAITATLAVGLVTPFVAYALLRTTTRLSSPDRGVIAAHYGSTSLVTFTAAYVYLQSISIVVPGYTATMLTVLEIPGLIVGLVLAHRGLAASDHATLPATIRDVITGKSIVLLVGGLVIGYALGESGFEPIAPVFRDAFAGILVFFLLGLGLQVGTQLRTVRSAGLGLVVFAVVFPAFIGIAAVTFGHLIGLPIGGSIILGVLAASASYIAAPAAVKFSLPQANLSIALTAALGITFPFNLIFGIPLFTWFALLISGSG